MKKIIFLFIFCINSTLFSQVDYSDSWEDFYSYNNVKDFIKVDNIIYALVDNAVFTFDENTLELEKFSSIKSRTFCPDLFLISLLTSFIKVKLILFN
jgi:hypothetical protein